MTSNTVKPLCTGKGRGPVDVIYERPLPLLLALDPTSSLPPCANKDIIFPSVTSHPRWKSERASEGRRTAKPACSLECGVYVYVVHTRTASGLERIDDRDSRGNPE